MAEQDQSSGTVAIKECPKCNTKMKITDALRGKRIKCPGCSILLKISDDGKVSVPVMTTFINAKICPECSTRMRITENLHGKKIKCPKCTTLLHISDMGEVSLKPHAKAEDEDIDQGDTQDQFDISAAKQTMPKPEPPEDDDDEQLTVGDEEPEQTMKEDEPVRTSKIVQTMKDDETKFEQKLPEREEIHVDDPAKDSAIFLKKEFKQKHFNILIYASFFVAVILLIILIIDIFTGFNLITSPIYGTPEAPVVDDGTKIQKQKSELEIAKDAADKAIEYLKKATSARKNLEIWNDSDKKGAILVDYKNGIYGFLEAQKLWFQLIINQIKKDGYEKGDISTNAENALTQAILNGKLLFMQARVESELNYIFTDTKFEELAEHMLKVRDSYRILVKKEAPEAKFDDLDEKESLFFDANSKRITAMMILNRYIADIANCDAALPKYRKMQKILEDTSMKFFENCWFVLEAYYKYMKYAKDYQLKPDMNIMLLAQIIESDSFAEVEAQMRNAGVNVDGKASVSEEVINSIAALKTEIGDYGN
ncbi:MAG: hypothetical protein K8S87_07320 [Planctomycetes bacterium]|nr:hypothetical protein [Planctomycetota bacterium]